MARIEIDLNDSNGIPVEIGDTVKVTLPEIEITNRTDKVYIPERIVKATVYFRASRGLLLKINEIVSVDGMDKWTEEEIDTWVGQIIPFKRTIWEWYKI